MAWTTVVVLVGFVYFWMKGKVDDTKRQADSRMVEMYCKSYGVNPFRYSAIANAQATDLSNPLTKYLTQDEINQFVAYLDAAVGSSFRIEQEIIRLLNERKETERAEYLSRKKR